MDQEKIIKLLRGLIVASKYPITLIQLDRNYLTIVGEKIPFAKLGYDNLEEFLKSAPTLKVFRNNHGELVVEAEKLAESAHIVEMVKKQKASRKRQKYVRFNSKAVVPTNWRPKYSSKTNKKYTPSSRVAEISHNQFVDYQKPTVASKVVVPEHSSYVRKNLPPRLQKQHSVGSRLQAQTQSQQAAQVAEQPVFTKENTGFMRSALKEMSKNNLEMENCSPGSSRRKTITKKMSEINLDRDSGNSSPVSDILSPMPPIIPTKIPEFIPTGDPKVDLHNFVEYHKLGKIDKTTTNMKDKHTKKCSYICKIKIGTNNFTSYPQEFSNPNDAELYCYQEAFKELSSKDVKKSLVLSNDRDILERIPKMLEKHNGGVWESQLQMDYTEKYNEQLPEDWLKIIDCSPCIHVEKLINRYTLRYCKPEEKGNMLTKNMTLTDVSVPTNTVEFGEDGKLYAEVTFVSSANEIWCRQGATEESEKFVEMVLSMEEYYRSRKTYLHASVINCNGYYVAEFENDWYRIRALKVTNDFVTCFFIDIGDAFEVPKTNIYQLEREFAVCQAQAFVCRLAGLEDLYEISVNSVMMASLIGRVVILEVASDNTVTDEDDVSLPVYMYDIETGNSINQEMIPLLTSESTCPNFSMDAITEAYVSYIAENGDVYIQIHSSGLEKLLTLLAELEIQVVSNPPTEILSKITKKNSRDKIYLGKYNADGHWHRVKIIDWDPSEKLAQIYYIDYGNTDVITIDESVLYPLEKLSDVVNQYQPQAVKTRMLLDEIPKNFLEIARKKIPIDDPVLIKVIRYNEDKIPVAEFFSKTPDGDLFCINKSIAIELELKKSEANANTIKPIRKNNNLLSTEVSSKNVPSGGKLKCPPLPNKHESLLVHIPFAVSPYNFFIQPLDSSVELHNMMKQLQERYKDVLYSPLTIDQIVPGNIYASKYDDGNWYRTSVIKVINDGSISVCYCDFGYYANLTLQQLIPLDKDFEELPYQALKAKISGIKPKDVNWTRNHCEEFKNMVEKKDFFSVLLNIERDQLYDSDLVLDLLLIDTSSNDDIYIDKELIKKNIAIEA